MGNRRIFRIFREGEKRRPKICLLFAGYEKESAKKKVSFYSESGETDLTEFVGSCYDGAAIN